MKLGSFYFALCILSTTTAFSIQSSRVASVVRAKPAEKTSSLFPTRGRGKSALQPLAATAISPTDDGSSNEGMLSFKTKYGYINPFGVYYGAVAILLGLPWYAALSLIQLLYKITNEKIDKMRKWPCIVSHVWGYVLLKLTRSYPQIENQDILDKFYKENRAAMFVANHNSWMDIPFICISIGWRNYKLISKAELRKVPILGKAIEVGGNVMVDRTNRRSQIQTLKAGMKWLEDGVHLAAFPEGTRSKTGRLLPFKNGVYKMASKVGAPIIPMSVVASGVAHPSSWMFPRRSSHKICKVIIHEPIESKGKTEAELAELVRAAVIKGLPESQRPLE